MSALLPNIICSAIMSIMGLIVVKYISGSNCKIITKRNIPYILMLIIFPVLMHEDEYLHIYTILIYIVNLFIYKEILNISTIKSIIACGIMIIGTFLLDFSASIILSFFLTTEQIRNNAIINIVMNIIFSATLISVFSIKKLRCTLPRLVNKLESKKAVQIVISLVLSIIVMSIILYVLTSNLSKNSVAILDYFIFIVFFILIVFMLGERNNFEKLSDEYDNLFNYVQIFEDWIEKEQLTRHEYKNQLAVIRSITKEKKVKDKIDHIVEDFINIDNKMIDQLKSLPNNGIKGLLYYKMSIAKKNKINLSIDVDDSVRSVLLKLSEEDLRTLTKLLGVYLDNAIEAALDTRKKIVTIEVYTINNNAKFVISNSFNKNNDISNRNKKGVSTKGEGRGNGLYFAGKLISKNKWIEEKQEIIDGFYIQSIIVKIVK